MIVRVYIRLKSEVLDPQGKAIGQALKSLGFTDIISVRQGKLIEIELGETSPEQAYRYVREMCEQLLAQPVIETYDISLQEDAPKKTTPRSQKNF